MRSCGMPEGLHPLRNESSRPHLDYTALQQEQAHQAAARHSNCMASACIVWNDLRSMH